MKLPMSDGEIAMRYRNAIDQKASIRILAELNDTEPSTIIAALARSGIEVPKGSRPKRKIAHGAAPCKKQFINEDLARELHSQGLNDREIGQRLGALSSTVCNWRRRNGLKANTKVGYQAPKTGADGNRKRSPK